MGRAIPTIPTEVPGNYNTSALFNASTGALGSFLLGPPVFSGYQATVQSVPNNTYTSLLIDTELVDSDSGHSTTTNTSRYTATVPGLYLVIGTTGWAANTTGLRRARLTMNGALIIGAAVASDAGTNNAVTGHCVSTFVTMNGTTDYVEIQGMQVSGAALNTSVSSDFTPSLRVYFLSR